MTTRLLHCVTFPPPPKCLDPPLFLVVVKNDRRVKWQIKLANKSMMTMLLLLSRRACEPSDSGAKNGAERTENEREEKSRKWSWALSNNFAVPASLTCSVVKSLPTGLTYRYRSRRKPNICCSFPSRTSPRMQPHRIRSGSSRCQNYISVRVPPI